MTSEDHDLFRVLLLPLSSYSAVQTDLRQSQSWNFFFARPSLAVAPPTATFNTSAVYEAARLDVSAPSSVAARKRPLSLSAGCT